MKIFKWLLLCAIFTTQLSCQAIDIQAVKTNEVFEEIARIDKLEQIKVNIMPRGKYTPKNLRTQYELRFTGKNTSTGAMTVWSNTFTDYDTKIMESKLEGNEYYIYDNTGKAFKTGEHVDLAPINESINTNTQNIQTNTQSINKLNQKVSKQSKNISQLRNQVSSMQQEMRSGLATVTALTSLHPNPRSKAPIELSAGVGMYKDQCAGAVGLFAHPTDNFMIQGGVAFGNNDDWAGYVGVTVGIDFHKRKK